MTLQPEEGAARVEAALAALPLRAAPFLPGETALAEALAPQGWLRTSPALWRERGGMDGFFVARMERR